MAILKCEMCGSSDIIKQNGVFVCQSCGTKYSVEDARKMMVEGTVEVQGTVKIDNSQSISNFLDIVRTSYKGYNYDKCIEYCDKILEIDNTNKNALILKANALCRNKNRKKNENSDNDNNYYRYDEALACIRKAISSCELSQEDIEMIAQVLSDNHFDTEDEDYESTLREVGEKYQKSLSYALIEQESFYHMNFTQYGWDLTSDDLVKLNTVNIVNLLKERLSEIMYENNYICSKTNFIEIFKNSNWIYSDRYVEEFNVYLNLYISQIRNINPNFSIHICEIDALKHALNEYINLEESRWYNGKEFISFVEKHIQYIRETYPQYKLSTKEEKNLKSIKEHWGENTENLTYATPLTAYTQKEQGEINLEKKEKSENEQEHILAEIKKTKKLLNVWLAIFFIGTLSFFLGIDMIFENPFVTLLSLGFPIGFVMSIAYVSDYYTKKKKLKNYDSNIIS